MKYVEFMVFDWVMIILLLLLMSAFARREKISAAFFILGIELVLFAFFLKTLFMYSHILFIIVIIYILVVIIWGRKKYYDLQVKEIEVFSPYIEKDITVGYIADFQYDRRLHVYNEKAYKNMIKKLNEQKFEVVLLGGDYINYEEHMDIFIKYLKEIDDKTKLISVFGNHDFPWKNKMKKEMAAIGITNLENEYMRAQVKDQEFLVVGLEDKWTGNAQYPEIKDEDKELAKLVLIHNPDSIKDIKDEKFDLALAGHYHKGQVNLLPKIYVASLVSKYVYGMYNNVKLYVTSGVGGTFFRGYISLYIRWNATPEIVKIKLKSSKNIENK